jgi:hypothetical protein
MYYKIILVFFIMTYPIYIYPLEEFVYIITKYISDLTMSIVYNTGYGNTSLEYGATEIADSVSGGDSDKGASYSNETSFGYGSYRSSSRKTSSSSSSSSSSGNASTTPPLDTPQGPTPTPTTTLSTLSFTGNGSNSSGNDSAEQPWTEPPENPPATINNPLPTEPDIVPVE